mmetsp:Transcript_30389/g.48690  ORF Transcript_30389/g.48690 Transcript_30389/m.48690 type:complete len:1768 (-) Transcript_30389:337-5640(-)
MGEPDNDEGGEQSAMDSKRMVALYDFDPKTIDWPFNRQKPLNLTTGQVVEIVHDDGTEWALGHLAGRPDQLGYFPKNFTVSVNEYHEMMRDFEKQERKGQRDAEREEEKSNGHETTAIPPGPLPAPNVDPPSEEEDEEEWERELPELVYPGISEYPPIEAQPPLETAYEITKSRLLREMPPVPDLAPEEPAPPEDDIVEARLQVQAELDAHEMDIAGGVITYSRCSTPATYAATRPERDFVRKNQTTGRLNDKYLRKVEPLMNLVRKNVRVGWEQQMPYKTDLRTRSTNLRMAAGIEPSHMRLALQKAGDAGAKWKQMFRPGFNDIVNESFKVACNSCILSNLYLRDQEAREQFQRLHVKDVNGTIWFELRRKKDHLFYMRMDFVDIMMCHPDAWGFPDFARQVPANPGEPVNPFHGWYAQHAINPDQEMEDVEFRYSLRLRSFPETTFSALTLGKIPEWIRPYMTLHAEAEEPDQLAIEEEEEAPGMNKHIDLEKNLMMEAGLEDGDDLYVKLDELRLARERTTGPDILDADVRTYRLKGLSAMRIFLRSRGNPDNMKQCLISPKMVKDMAAQLGIQKDHHLYWYCMFALRYPLAPEWEAIVRDDTRWYLNLPEDRAQPVHPMVKKFREHLSDVAANQFLWDFRGFVKMKCSECGIPDSVVWCQQCTDYYCAPCFLQSHKSKRGKKHWPIPTPGCRYLTAAESKRFSENLPLLNIGFSNRRRFLARDNQSDKNGPRNGDTWLYFHADTFQAALVQTPASHWCLKRNEPPRLPPGVDGYYYNFATDTLADDASYINATAHEQLAISLLQRHIRGALTRRHIMKETNAALVLQKTKMMWDVQKVHGTSGKNAGIIKSWFRKHQAKEDKHDLSRTLSKIQGLCRGFLTRRRRRELYVNTTRFQSCWRGTFNRRIQQRRQDAALIIQRGVRGMIYGRRFMRNRHLKAARIQALIRGIMHRALDQKRLAAAVRIQSHSHGMVSRAYVKKIQRASTMLQTNWRRFQAQVDVKQILFERMDAIRLKRIEVLRGKLTVAACTLIQRNFKRYRDAQVAIDSRREKGEADKRTTTMLVALFSGAASLRQYVHPWLRHLPLPIQAVLKELKGPMQKTIAMVPLQGKLSSEDLGKRGLTVASAEHLTYRQDTKDPDLASHLLLCISRHLLSHVPTEVFPETMKWACYAIGHQSVKLFNTNGCYMKEEIPVGKEMPPHPNDSLHTFYKDTETVKQRVDNLITLPSESLPITILNGMPSHHRHVYLTAEVLVTMRQALDAPSISTDDHLKFQGLDASAGAQMMEVLGSELDHRLPLDWPNSHGTVSALAAQIGEHIAEIQAEGASEITKGGQKPNRATSKSKASGKPKKVEYDAEGAKVRRPDEEIGVAQFNRAALMRVVQQVGFLMRDQHKIIDSVLGIQDEESARKGEGVRQGRFVAMTDRLFDMADKAPHDHCSFCLAVVLFHMILRALLMRLLYHRAAMALQKRYRYFRNQGKKNNRVAPAVCIQRFWRGLRESLRICRQESAAEKIQHSWRTTRWNRRARQMLHSTLTVQRLWQGAVVRHWLKTLRTAATDIQRYARGMMVRVALDKSGRNMVRKLQAEMTAVAKRKGEMSETEYFARGAVLAGKAKITLAKHRDHNVDLRRNAASTLKSKHARTLDKQKKIKMMGSLQPIRPSIFEPFPFALRRIARDSSVPARYGAPKSGVLQFLRNANKMLGKTMPTEGIPAGPVHAAAKRGQAAMMARRLAKKCELTAPKSNMLNDRELEKWMLKQFSVNG